MTKRAYERLVRWWGTMAVASLMAAMATGSSVWAQSIDALSPERLCVDQLVVLARETLTGNDHPRPDQWTRAKILLDLATEFDPRDANVWRLQVEVARGTGDREGETAALKRYCVLRPEDDAAQLAWIMKIIEDHQTLEARVEAAEKILEGKGAGRLSAPLRSRLASYVAQSAREIGDTAKMTRWLKVATNLDRSNQDAAILALDWLRSASASPLQIGQALAHWVWADPVNPRPRRQLAQVLLSQGAFSHAAQQYQAAQTLGTGSSDDRFVYNWVHSLAASGQVDRAMELLAQYEATLTPPLSAQPVSSPQSSASPIPPIDAVGLPLDLELLRLALLGQSAQKTRASGSYKRIQKLIEQQAQKNDGQAELDLMWLGLLMDQVVPEPERLEQLRSASPDSPLVARIIGWSHLRTGERQAALRAFAPSFDGDPFAAYGVAQIYDQTHDVDRLRQLQMVVAMAPDNLAGMMAACDLISAGAEPQATDQGAELVRVLDTWQRKMVSPNPTQDAWTALSIHVKPIDLDYLQPVTARLKLRNLTDFPLSLGPGQSVPSRLLLHVSMRQGGASLGNLPSIVLDVQRRLRLAPRGVLEVNARLDRAVLGSVLSLSPIVSIGFDVTATLGPRFEPTGGMSTQLLGVSDSAYLLQRYGVTLTGHQVDQWTVMLGDADPVRQMHGAAKLVRASTLLDDSEAGAAVGQKISDAINGHYDQMTPLIQAWTVRFLPPGQKGQLLFEAVHELAQRSNDPAVRLIYAATQIKNPKSVVIDAMLRHRDRRLVTFGQALRIGLEALESPDQNNQPASDVPSSRGRFAP